MAADDFRRRLNPSGTSSGDPTYAAGLKPTGSGVEVTRMAGRPLWVKVLIGVAVAFGAVIALGIVASVALPVYLAHRGGAASAATPTAQAVEPAPTPSIVEPTPTGPPTPAPRWHLPARGRVAIAFSGPGGEWLSQGRSWAMSTAGAVTVMHQKHTPRLLFLQLMRRGRNPTWTTFLVATAGGKFSRGRYDGAARNVTQGQARPMLDLGYASRGCDNTTGAFTITSVGYDHGRLVRLAGRFSLRCLPERGQVTGAFRWAGKA